MDRLFAMNVFATVADLRGFAAAAKRLRLSPSAVTRTVAALEDHLGARLLQRTTRSVALTDEGVGYLERARRILADVAEAEAATLARRTVPSGRFSLSAPNVFGRLHVAPLMCAYLARYPLVTGELMLADRVANLVDDGLDAAVRIGALDDSSLVVRSLGATRRVLVASPAYLQAQKKIRAPGDLSTHVGIQFTALTPTPEWRLSSRGGEVRIPFVPSYVTNSADAAIGHTVLGGGLTTALAYQVIDAVRAGKLRVVLPAFEPPPLPIQIVFPTARQLSVKVRAFVELVSASCDWRFVEL